MTPLRQAMIDECRLRGLAKRTEETYLYAVEQLSRHYHQRPDTITEEQVDLYLSGIENIEGKRVLRYLSVNTQNGVLLPSGNSSDNWDVAEFAVNMKDFENND